MDHDRTEPAVITLFPATQGTHILMAREELEKFNTLAAECAAMQTQLAQVKQALDAAEFAAQEQWRYLSRLMSAIKSAGLREHYALKSVLDELEGVK